MHDRLFHVHFFTSFLLVRKIIFLFNIPKKKTLQQNINPSKGNLQIWKKTQRDANGWHQPWEEGNRSLWPIFGLFKSKSPKLPISFVCLKLTSIFDAKSVQIRFFPEDDLWFFQKNFSFSVAFFLFSWPKNFRGTWQQWQTDGEKSSHTVLTGQCNVPRIRKVNRTYILTF